MAVTVRELVTKWGFDVDDRPLKAMNEKVTALKGTLSTIGIAVGAAAGTLFGLAKVTADAGDRALETAKKIGINVRALQQWEFAAKTAGVSNEGLANGIRFLSRNMVEAAKGSKTANEPFRRLGVSVRDARGQLRPTEAVLSELSDRFQSLPNGPERTAVAMELFGRAGADMIPLLAKGSKEIAVLRARAEELGLVFTEQEALLADEFNDAVDEATGALSGLSKVIGKDLIRALLPTVKAFTEYLIVNRKIVAQNIGKFFEGLSGFLSRMIGLLQTVTTAVNGLLSVFGGLAGFSKLFGTIFAVFLGGKLVFGIGSVALSLVTLGKQMRVLYVAGVLLNGLLTGRLVAAWRLVGNTALVAQAKALAVPLAIGAAIIAVGLIIEDFVAFLQGKKSVFGLVGEALGGAFTKVSLMIGDVLAKIALAVGDITNRALKPFTDFMDRISNGSLADGFAKFTKSLGGGINTALDSVSGGFNSGLDSALGFLGITPQSAPAVSPAASGGAGGNAPQINVTQSTTVTVPEGTPASEVGPRVQQGVREGVMDSMLRATRRSFAGGAVQ